MADNKIIECPVCNCKFATSKINAHVDLCLNKVEKCSTRRTAGSNQEGVGTAKPTSESSSPGAASDLKISSTEQNEDTATEDDWKIGHNVPSVTRQQSSSMASAKGSKKTDPSREKKIFFSPTRSLSDVLGKRKQTGNLQISPKEDIKKQRIDENESRNAKEQCPKLNGSNLYAESQQNEAKTVFQSTDKMEQRNNIAVNKSKSQNRRTVDLSRKVDLSKGIPLAEQMRPTSFDSYFGQDDVTGENTTLRSILQSERFPSMILWGPPGCGKV